MGSYEADTTERACIHARAHTHTLEGTIREGSQSTIMVRSIKRQHLPGQYEKIVILDPHWEVTLEVSESA